MVVTVNDPAGTPANRKVTATNLITKAHGLSDGARVIVSSGALASNNTDLPVADGGTGASNASGARANLGAVNIAGDTMTGQLGFSGTGHAGLKLNSLTTTQRDALTPAEGMLIYNSTSSTVQKYQGGSWSDVTAATGGDFSSNTSTSVDSEIVLFSGTGGKTGKRATATGILKGTSGVLSAATAGTDYYNPGGTDVAVADGGTGASTATAGFDALSPMTTAGDIIYGGASGTRTRLGIGTALQVLRTNAGATAPEWATISSGGQSTYDAIVASSGGDYTTLGAAIAAASAGWRIFVKDGTYSESAISTSLTDLVIEGESNNKAIISHGANNITFSGANVTASSLGFTGSTATVAFSGAEATVQNNRFVYSSTGLVRFTGGESSIGGNVFSWSTTGSVSTNFVELGGNYVKFIGNYVYANARSTTANTGVLRIGGAYNTITGNVLRGRDACTNGSFVINSTGGNSITGNEIISWQDGGNTVCAKMKLDDSDTFSGNFVYRCFLNLATGRVTISGNNMFHDSATSGIVVDGVGCVISGNNMNGGNGTGTGIMITNTAADGTVISGNNIYRYTTNGVNVSSSSHDNTRIVGNVFDTITTPVADSGTGTVIKDNFGTYPSEEKEVISATNTSGGTINAGEVVVWKAVASGNEVTTTTTASDSKVYGMAIEAISNNAKGRILVRGKTTLLKVNGTADIAIGDYLTTYTSAGISQKATPATLGVTLGDLAFAIALEAYTGDDSNGVIDALLVVPRRL